jgi:hypothetical protein
MHFIRWFAFVIGLFGAIITSGSLVGTLVVPRGINSRISRVSATFIDLVFRLVTHRSRDFESRDRMLSWQSPIGLVFRLVVWLVLLFISYGLMLLPFMSGAVTRAFAQAGSSMFTLGYAAPFGDSITVIDYAAALTGLLVVGLQIGYLPTLYSAFNKRETEVTLLVSRAGLPAWGPEILARTKFGIVGDTDDAQVMADLFAAWERWAAEVGESHATYLTLVRFRSPRPLSHWLTSLIAVMDAAALHLSLAPTSRPGIEARLCLRMGFTALNQIAMALGLVVDDDPSLDKPISISKQQFADAVELLRGLDYPIERDVDEAWPHFRGWRANYDEVALAMAKELDAPPAMWTGSRRWPSEPIAPFRPANRTPGERARPIPKDNDES